MTTSTTAAPVQETLQPELDLSTLSTDELEKILQKRKDNERIRKEESRKSYEQMRDQEVQRLGDLAVTINGTIRNYKDDAFKTMNALYELLQDHSKRHGDGKGNFSVESGGYRIKYRRQENGFFDERSEQAEKHIIDFVTEKFKDQDDTRDLIMSLLERKKDTLDIKLVQKLYAMEDRFTDENWKQGIRLLKESWRPSDTKDYITVEKKLEDNSWQQINLNFAGV